MALFFSQHEKYKSHLVVVGDVLKGGWKAKVDELGSHWSWRNGVSGWVTRQLSRWKNKQVNKQALNW